MIRTEVASGGNNLGNTALGTFTTAQVPEATSLVLALIGMAGLLVLVVSVPSVSLW
jgi:hypothetical protein